MRIKLLIFCLFFTPLAIVAQEGELDGILEDITSDATDYTSATFKSTRIINGHSIERMMEGELDFRVSHRFDRLNKGLYYFFGMDESNTLFSLEYGITDNIMAGIGRTTYHKTYQGFLKFLLLRQSTGGVNMPLSLSFFSSASANSIKLEKTNPGYSLESRMEYVFQLLMARKFTSDFSFQLSPTILHRNLISDGDDNDIYALGFGARYKFSNWVSVNAEYFYVHNKDEFRPNKIYNPISVGFDIETGGHVFQLCFSNTISMLESGFIGSTEGNWQEGDIHFGFNISRVFTIY